MQWRGGDKTRSLGRSAFAHDFHATHDSHQAMTDKQGALVRLLPVKAAAPSLKDNTADLDRLKRALRPQLADRPLLLPTTRLAHLARNFRRHDFAGVAVGLELDHGLELIDFLAAPPAMVVGMALDLGTTHLEASLVELRSGRILARAHCENPQIVHGADILSRIHFADQNGGLPTLQQEIITAINGLAVDLTTQAATPVAEILVLTVAGNTTMTHFLLGLSPHHICREPYIPLANHLDPLPAAALGLQLHPAARVWVLPNIGSYFGGDLIAGIVASGLDEQEETAMLIDVGTNAEVILGNRDWLIACAGAAGPALEGGVARMGMRAGPGAIEHVEINPADGTIAYTTIANQPPKGICGSGVIDLVAGLYLARLIDIRGKFRPRAMGDRLVQGEDGPAFVVATAAQGAEGRPVLLGQVDLDALMRSKAAMYAILTTLTNQVGINFEQLQHIYVAGAFGRHIAPRQAIVLGMLPDLPLATYIPIGNSSLAGAEKVLLEPNAWQRCSRAARRITYVELNVNQEFMLRFSGSRFIPHTDHNLFPSVPFFEEA